MKYVKGMESALLEYKHFPTIEDIQRDYNEWREVTRDIQTIEKVQELVEKGYGDTIFINDVEAEDYIKAGGTNEGITEITYGHFGCLDCIRDKFGSAPTFDVFSKLYEYDFISGARIDQVEERYKEGIESALEKGVRLHPERFTRPIVEEIKDALENTNGDIER